MKKFSRKFILISFGIICLMFTTFIYKLGFHDGNKKGVADFLIYHPGIINILNDADFKIIIKMVDDDFERIKEILEFSHIYAVEKGLGCSETALAFSLMARRNGFTADAQPAGGHWIAEVYSNKYAKMVAVDPYFNIYYTDLDGTPLRLRRLYGKFHVNYGSPDPRYHLKKIIYENNGAPKLKYETFDEALRAIKKYFREHGVVMVEAMSEKRKAEYRRLYKEDPYSIIDLTPRIFELYVDDEPVKS